MRKGNWTIGDEENWICQFLTILIWMSGFKGWKYVLRLMNIKKHRRSVNTGETMLEAMTVAIEGDSIRHMMVSVGGHKVSNPGVIGHIRIHSSKILIVKPRFF